MNITNSEVKQYQMLCMDKFGIELDEKTARGNLLKLVTQMHLVYRQITPEQLAEYESKNESVNEDSSNEQARATSNS